MKKRIKALVFLLILVLVAGFLPSTALASIDMEIDRETTTETVTEETTSRTTASSEYTHTTTTTATTTTRSSTAIVFIPVRSITRVPESTTVRIPLRLSGSIHPSDSTNRNIRWDIYDPGSTGAYITGDNVLNTTAPGTVTVRAIITNGTYANVDYHERFSVKVLAPRFESAPARVTNLNEHAYFEHSGNFYDLHSLSLNGHELVLTNDNERMLLFGYPGFTQSLGQVRDGSNVIRLNRAFLNFLPDGVYTLSATYRIERANGRLGRPYATTETIFVLDRSAYNGIPKTGDDSNMSTWIMVFVVSVISLLSLLIWRGSWSFNRNNGK